VTLRFGTFLGCTAALALLAVAFPGLVLAGLLFGILPGLILAISPNLMLYVLPWWGLRELILKGASRAGLTPASDLGTRMLRRSAGLLVLPVLAVPAILLPSTINERLQNRVAALRAEDQSSTGPIELPTTIKLISNHEFDWRSKKPNCDTLCQRLLYNGAVTRVIRVNDAYRAARAFWIERRAECPPPPIERSMERWPNDPPLMRGEKHVDPVRARISQGECLISGDAKADDPSVTILLRTPKRGMSIYDRPWSLDPDDITAHRLEILSADGRTIYRRTEVTVQLLVAPLLIEFRAGLLTTVRYAGWARTQKTYAPFGFDGRDILSTLLGAAVRRPS
jgi:hypothetical protein